MEEGQTNSVFKSAPSDEDWSDSLFKSTHSEEDWSEKKTADEGRSKKKTADDGRSKKESARIRYQRLQDDHDGFLPAQFDSPDIQVPVKAIILASFLFLAGFAAIAFGSLSLLGYLDPIPDTGPIVMLVLGLLMFIPGSYHVRIAYYAFKDEPGYSFDDIPDFN